MKTCKDCIHDKVCDMLAGESGIPFVNADTCEHFKDKSLVLDLPCKVGDTVYRQRKNGQSLKKYENVSLEWIVAHIQEFGIYIFLTIDDWLESAEQTVRERE